MKSPKLLISLIFFAALVFCLSLFSYAITYDFDIPYENPCGVVLMPYGTPKINGDISQNEGYGKQIEINEKNMIPTLSYYVFSEPSAKIGFAYDKENMYVYADITDDDFIYCTKEYIDDDVYTNDYPKNTNFYGYDGDEFALTLDPARLMEYNGQTLYSDMSSWLCFGLFEDGHIGVYRTFLGTKNLTNEITAKGKRTSYGWILEAAIPWNIIKENLYYSSFDMIDFDYDTITANGTESRACAFLIDRFISPETEELETEEIFATLDKYSAKGVKTTYNRTPSIGTYGIKLIPVKDGYTYTEKEERETLLWKNTFSDVKDNKWYYNGISYSCNNGWFAGTSKNTFSPSDNMTRAMAVTVLSSFSKYDGTDVIDNLYTDVSNNKWYSKAITWAYKREIAKGTSETEFSPDKEITREEFSLLIYKLSQFKKYRTDNIPDDILNSYPDKDSISNWAIDSMKFCVYHKLLSGQKNNNDILLAPAKHLTRAECAAILKAFDNADFSRFANEDEYCNISINGNDISEYSIIYGSEKQDKKSAQELQKYIRQTSDISIDIYLDSEKEPAEYEILIGTTNRENQENSIDRTDVSLEGYTIVSKGSKLYITGGKKNGTLYGTYYFIEEYLGYVYADNIERRYYNQSINIENISITRNSMMKNLGWVDSLSKNYLNKLALCGSIKESDDGHLCGIQYLLENGDWSNYGIQNPCYSDPALIQKVCDLLLKRMENDPTHTVFSLGTYDNVYYCMCDRCQEIYREEKSRAGTYIRLVNYCAKQVKEKFPNNKIYFIGYDFTIDPPVCDIEDNVVFRFINIDECFHHPINDPNCPLNRALYNDILKWREKVDILWTADHGNNGEQSLNSLMDFDMIYENVKFYSSIGVDGFFYWAFEGTDGEFNSLRNYLWGHMFWNNSIDRDEFQIYIEEFLEAYYGNANKEIEKYIDDLTIIQNDTHYNGRATSTATVSNNLYINSDSTLASLWANALEKTKSNEQAYENVRRSMASYLFIKQSLMWEKEYKNGNEEQKEKYKKTSEELIDIIFDYGIRWGDVFSAPVRVKYEYPPEYWS